MSYDIYIISVSPIALIFSTLTPPFTTLHTDTRPKSLVRSTVNPPLLVCFQVGSLHSIVQSQKRHPPKTPISLSCLASFFSDKRKKY